METDRSSSLLEAHGDDVLSCHLVHLEKPEETQRNSGKWAVSVSLRVRVDIIGHARINM